jgi:hypothetical protein
VGEWTRREFFENKCVEKAAALGQLRRNRGGDRFGRAVGDQSNLFLGLDAETGKDSGAGAGGKFGRIGLREKMRCGFGKACDDGAPVWGSCARTRIPLR